jgi:hypothetical protein
VPSVLALSAALPPVLAVPLAAEEGNLRDGLDASQVTPGTLGFLLTLFIVVASIFLIRDMVKRIRRVRYRAEVAEAQLREDTGDNGHPADDGGR